MTTNTVIAPAARRQRDWLSFASQFGAFIALVVLCVVFAILEPAFLTERNIFNVLRQVSIYGLLAIGMTFVILTGGIDLSVGSVLALTGLVAAVVYKGGRTLLTAGTAGQAEGYGLITAILAALAIGLFLGFLHGAAIVWLRVPPFIATLGGITAWRGLSLMLSQGQPISNFPPEYQWFGKESVGPVPVLVLILVIAALIGWIVLRYSRYGRQVYAVGGNQEAARLSGLNTRNVILSVYVISGFMAGLSGFLLSSRLNSAEQVAGVGYELTVIAGVVIGGTSFSGGEGSIPGTILGVLLIGVLANGLTLMNVPPYIQQVLTGLIIVFAVWFDQAVKRRRG